MYTTYFWDKFYLQGNKAQLIACLSIVFISLTASPTFAQGNDLAWFRVKRSSGHYAKDADKDFFNNNKKKLTRDLNYGFLLGLNQTRFIAPINHPLPDSISTVIPLKSIGFSVGFVLNKRLKEFWDVRITPTVGFFERNLEYRFQDSSAAPSTKNIEMTMLEVPVLFKYRSALRGRTGMYLVGGLKPGFVLSAQKQESLDLVRVGRSDLSIEYGFGLDIFYSYFKFSPELRFSHGISNMLINDRNPYSRTMKGLFTHNVSLYLHFE
ncbi:MAG: PorT family protein [Microscillaceae bacterium]|nr:PorT family protein [Microscillaceae bacterium]MDW8461973.1 porin family protein [Cytophagales bacterium]